MGVPGWWRARRRGWKASANGVVKVRVVAARAALAVRHHYMLGLTAIVLGFAAAGGLGYFDKPAPGASSRGTAAREPAAAPFVVVPGPPRTPAPIRSFEFNVFLVSTPEQQQTMQIAENQYRSPYLLGGRASEVLLVRTVEDELMAAHWVEEVRATFPGANIVVTDLR